MKHEGLAYTLTGSGDPVLLLHGFPQCQAMWGPIVAGLSERFTCVTLDLPGYGDSDGGQSVGAASFRAMGDRVLALLDHLDLPRVHLVGHDRGGRLAHRLALDVPDRVRSLTVMDIVPTYEIVAHLRADVAKAYYHWFFLAQPAPFPETLIGHEPDAYFESCLAGWGGDGLGSFDPEALEIYRKHWRQPEVIHAMCNDYRAALEIDVVHDEADLDRRVSCPSLVLWGQDGLMAQAYDVAATWEDRLTAPQTQGLPGGHFFPDTHPQETLAALRGFLAEV